MDRMSNTEDSSYQPIDQRVQERLERREATNEDRIARMDAPVSHQVRERRFVSTPDFVDIQESVVDDTLIQEEQKQDLSSSTRGIFFWHSLRMILKSVIYDCTTLSEIPTYIERLHIYVDGRKLQRVT